MSMDTRLSGKQVEDVFNGAVMGQEVIKNEGVIAWTTENKLYYRVEWRVEDEDIIYNFYHPKAPNPAGSFEEDRTRTDERGNTVVDFDHGEPIHLPESFDKLLEQVCAHVAKGGVQMEMERIPEVFSIQVRAKGAGRNPMARHHYTTGFFAIISANIKDFAPDMLPS